MALSLLDSRYWFDGPVIAAGTCNISIAQPIKKYRNKYIWYAKAFYFYRPLSTLSTSW